MILWTITILSIFGNSSGILCLASCSSPLFCQGVVKHRVSKLKKIILPRREQSVFNAGIKFSFPNYCSFFAYFFGIPDISAIPPALSETGP